MRDRAAIGHHLEHVPEFREQARRCHPDRARARNDRSRVAEERAPLRAVGDARDAVL